jgi:CheY-like chemotaxis protein
MATNVTRRKQVLFVDDDPAFLGTIRELFMEMSRGRWEVLTAESHAQALDLLRQQRMDVTVLDIGMPVMDGPQFLRLIGRAHPGQQVVILTGRPTEEARKTCLENGAVLFLEKPVQADGYSAVFAALDALAEGQPQSGFRGMMRRVGLHEVLQMECLSRKSSVLEIFTARVRGRIFIHDGSIVHAESGTLQGEVALYGLLALRGGDFNFLTFTEPSRRTIQGQWESLLMEAARLSDESAAQQKEVPFEAGDQAPVEPQTSPEQAAEPPRPAPPGEVRIRETVLCSGAGEVLYEWECKALQGRVRLLEQVEQQAEEISNLAPVGRFDRVEVIAREGRFVCHVQPHMRLLVHSVEAPGDFP